MTMEKKSHEVTETLHIPALRRKWQILALQLISTTSLFLLLKRMSEIYGPCSEQFIIDHSATLYSQSLSGAPACLDIAEDTTTAHGWWVAWCDTGLGIGHLNASSGFDPAAEYQVTADFDIGDMAVHQTGAAPNRWIMVAATGDDGTTVAHGAARY
jgi:hypothetical protein